MRGSSTTTTTTPNPLAEQQANIAKQIGPKLLQNVLAGLSGGQTGGAFRQAQQGQQAMRQNAARMGISMGDPRMMQGLLKANEAATKPDQSALGLGQTLYTGAPNSDPLSQSSKGKPGTMDYVGSLLSLLSLFGA